MKLAIAIACAAAFSGHAAAGKYMMGPVPSSGWSWVGDAIQAGTDIGPQIAVFGHAGDGAGAAVEGGLQIGLFRPVRSWFARPAFEAGVTVGRALVDGRWQVRTAIGTSAGPVVLAIGWTEELRGDDESGTAFGPELRVRHRHGDGARKPSFGMFVRADVFVTDRAHHADRVAIGVFGMLDVL